MSKQDRPAKNGFLIYKTQWEPICELENEELGALFRALFEYQFDGTEPPKKSPIAPYFKFFKAQFAIDENGYRVVVEKKRLAGIASAEARKKAKEQEPTQSTPVESVQHSQQRSTQSTKPTDKEKDKDNGNENVNGKEKENTFTPSAGECPSFRGEEFQKRFQAAYKAKQGKPYPMLRVLTKVIQAAWDQKKIPPEDAITSLCAVAEIFMEFHRLSGTEPRYIPNPETWLEDGGFLSDWQAQIDQLKITQNTPRNHGKPESATTKIIRHAAGLDL